MQQTRTATATTPAPSRGFQTAMAARLRALREACAMAWAQERDHRRPFLWLPVAAGVGAIVNLAADRDPSLGAALIAATVFGAGAFALRSRPVPYALALLGLAFALGHASTGLRVARVAAPVLPKLTITAVTGFVEQVDHRRERARIVLRLTGAEGLAPESRPKRVRLTTRSDPGVAAGDHVALKARLLPPARAALPGGYDFARDAYFAGIGAVGNALGRIERKPADTPAPFALRLSAAVDHARNALVQRIAARLPGDTGAIAAAMVTGKRDLLTDQSKELIREAGIFHIITISGIQMTLVAGIFFIGLRRLFALSQTLALDYSVKKWAAVCALFGAVLYDILTGSRVGTERALVMTTVLLGAVIVDRPALSMRNLAFAAVFVVAVEPEALLGASFQLSFAAVAALIAVWETRNARRNRSVPDMPLRTATAPSRLAVLRDTLASLAASKIGAMLVATFCATLATASFMAYNFHELSPYVLIGNPLTMAMIEFFAVPAALLGTVLYPFGLDGPIWTYLGIGIDLVLWIAKRIAAAPGSTVHLLAFDAPAVCFLALAVVSATLWRTALLRATALPLALVGLMLAMNGSRFDLAVASTGDVAAVRDADGTLQLLGKRGGAGFAAEQWLRADGDRRPVAAMEEGACDTDGCVARLPDGRAVSLILKEGAFLADCERAHVIISPLFAPSGCGAPFVIDRRKLAGTGAVTLDLRNEPVVQRHARASDEDRPWSRAPRANLRRATRSPPVSEEAERAGESRALGERLE